MTLADAEKLREEVLNQMSALNLRYPGERTFESIIEQLRYVGGFLVPEASTMPRLAEINFGFLGVKFVMEYDEQISRNLAKLNQFINVNFS